MNEALENQAIQSKQGENIEEKHKTFKTRFQNSYNAMVDKYRILLLALSMILNFLFWELFVPNEDDEDAPSLKLET